MFESIRRYVDDSYYKTMYRYLAPPLEARSIAHLGKLADGHCDVLHGPADNMNEVLSHDIHWIQDLSKVPGITKTLNDPPNPPWGTRAGDHQQATKFTKSHTSFRSTLPAANQFRPP